MYEKYCYMQLYLRSKWKLFGFESEECAIEIINSFQNFKSFNNTAQRKIIINCMQCFQFV